MDNSLEKRIADLNQACRKRGAVTASSFLTPAEQKEAEYHAPLDRTGICFFGGASDCERKMMFFHPDYYDAGEIEYGDFIEAVKITVKQKALSHRDILGSVIGCGLRRDQIGDIRVFDSTAYVFLTQTAAKAVEWSLEQIGRTPCEAEIIPLSEVPVLELKTRELRFTVQSIRLDAVMAGLFRISRTDATAFIKAGNVTLNYLPCVKPDAHVSEGDIIAARGFGKGKFCEVRGESKKGRTFITVERYL